MSTAESKAHRPIVHPLAIHHRWEVAVLYTFWIVRFT